MDEPPIWGWKLWFWQHYSKRLTLLQTLPIRLLRLFTLSKMQLLLKLTHLQRRNQHNYSIRLLKFKAKVLQIKQFYAVSSEYLSRQTAHKPALSMQKRLQRKFMLPMWYKLCKKLIWWKFVLRLPYVSICTFFYVPNLGVLLFLLHFVYF